VVDRIISSSDSRYSEIKAVDNTIDEIRVFAEQTMSG